MHKNDLLPYFYPRLHQPKYRKVIFFSYSLKHLEPVLRQGELVS